MTNVGPVGGIGPLILVRVLADRTFAQSLARPDWPSALSAKINTAGVSGDLRARLAG